MAGTPVSFTADNFQVILNSAEMVDFPHQVLEQDKREDYEDLLA